jgi:uncharacterized protein
LVIPLYKSDGTVDTTVVTAANSLCEQRRAIQLVDALPTWDDTADVTSAFTTGFDQALGTNSKNAALVFPRNPTRSRKIRWKHSLRAVRWPE